MPFMIESGGTSPRMDLRIIQAHKWLSECYTLVSQDFFPVAGDASFRRYFRVRVDGDVHILMDAPPDKESCDSFLDVTKRLHDAGLHAPEILASNLEQGFLLLEDLGDELFRDLLAREKPEPLFEEAFSALAVFAREVDSGGLPSYDEASLHDDLNLFTDLYLVRHKHVLLKHQQRLDWTAFCDELVQSALQQPQVFVHKDFHSCNLLRTSENSPGIIDFQDAIKGPVTYDFVSLIWDRYIPWPREQIEAWMEQFRLLAAPDIPSDQWVYYCDLMGLQRNLRIVGRFAQLEYFEGKSGYLEMIPRFFQYALDVLPRYPQFSGIEEWIGSEACAP